MPLPIVGHAAKVRGGAVALAYLAAKGVGVLAKALFNELAALPYRPEAFQVRQAACVDLCAKQGPLGKNPLDPVPLSGTAGFNAGG